MNLWVVRRSFLVLTTIVALAVAVVIGPARPASAACTCQAASVAQGFVDSQVIFTGELVEVIPGETLDTLRFNVDLVYKGDVSYDMPVATLSSSDDCGLDNPPLGKWMIFASQFPDATGPLIVNTCGPSAPLVAGEDLAPEFVNGVPPPDTPIPPSTSAAPPVSIAGELPSDWRPPAIASGFALVVLGLVSRLLAGRRRTVR